MREYNFKQTCIYLQYNSGYEYIDLLEFDRLTFEGDLHEGNICTNN
jgi:hypothetical protein